MFLDSDSSALATDDTEKPKEESKSLDPSIDPSDPLAEKRQQAITNEREKTARDLAEIASWKREEEAKAEEESYVAIGTRDSWDGRKETAEDPYAVPVPLTGAHLPPEGSHLPENDEDTKPSDSR